MSETRTSQETLSGQQLQAIQKWYADEVRKVAERMQVRALALEQAVKVVTTPGLSVGSTDTVKLAVSMFHFLTADLVIQAPAPQTPPAQSR